MKRLTKRISSILYETGTWAIVAYEDFEDLTLELTAAVNSLIAPASALRFYPVDSNTDLNGIVVSSHIDLTEAETRFFTRAM